MSTPRKDGSKVRTRGSAHVEFSKGLFAGRIKGPENLPRLHARAFISYITSELLSGHRVNIDGLGTLQGVFRIARVCGNFKSLQPATYRLQLVPSRKMKLALRKLAAENPKAFTDKKRPNQTGRAGFPFYAKNTKTTETPQSV